MTESSPRRSFVERHTRLQAPPFVPELRLHLAPLIVPVWQSLSDAAGEFGPPPYWAFAWVGGLGLARFVLDHADEVAGKDVLDIATGSGLCAIAALRAGAKTATAVDTDPFCEEVVAMNAVANEAEVSFERRGVLETEHTDADVVLAGDVCYAHQPAGDMIAWLRMAHERGTRVLIGDPGRPFFPHKDMVQLAEYRIPGCGELEDADVKWAGVFTFR